MTNALITAVKSFIVQVLGPTSALISFEESNLSLYPFLDCFHFYCSPWASTIKLFYGRNLRIFAISSSVIPGTPFQPILMFVGKVRSLF